MNTFVHKDYDEYVNAQYHHTHGKTGLGKNIVMWASENMLRQINNLLHTYVGSIQTIVCHGCRNGFEVHILQNLNPDAKVFGTDLYELAYKYDKNYFRKMDFDVVPEDWKGYFDVVYSNSIDHSRNQINTLTSWKSELKKNGICFITFQFTNRKVNVVDCFSLSVDGYRTEIEEMAKEVGMKVLYCSEPETTNRWRGRYVHVVLK